MSVREGEGVSPNVLAQQAVAAHRTEFGVVVPAVRIRGIATYTGKACVSRQRPAAEVAGFETAVDDQIVRYRLADILRPSRTRHQDKRVSQEKQSSFPKWHRVILLFTQQLSQVDSGDYLHVQT